MSPEPLAYGPFLPDTCHVHLPLSFISLPWMRQIQYSVHFPTFRHCPPAPWQLYPHFIVLLGRRTLSHSFPEESSSREPMVVLQWHYVKSRSTPVGGPVKSGQKRTKDKGRGLDNKLVQPELVTAWIQWLRTTSVDPLCRFRSRGWRWKRRWRQTGTGVVTKLISDWGLQANLQSTYTK